jgi:hypothetical protein
MDNALSPVDCRTTVLGGCNPPRRRPRLTLTCIAGWDDLREKNKDQDQTFESNQIKSNQIKSYQINQINQIKSSKKLNNKR